MDLPICAEFLKNESSLLSKYFRETCSSFRALFIYSRAISALPHLKYCIFIRRYLLEMPWYLLNLSSCKAWVMNIVWSGSSFSSSLPWILFICSYFIMFMFMAFFLTNLSLFFLFFTSVFKSLSPMTTAAFLCLSTK